MKKTLTVAILALAIAACPAAYAQTPSPDPVAAALISPDLVMTHQDALGLSEAQRAAIQADMQNAQQRFTHFQWQLAAAQEKLVGLLKQGHVDQSKALAALDGVLKLEREVKRTQLTLMMQIKNALTADQQERARRLAGNGSR